MVPNFSKKLKNASNRRPQPQTRSEVSQTTVSAHGVSEQGLFAGSQVYDMPSMSLIANNNAQEQMHQAHQAVKNNLQQSAHIHFKQDAPLSALLPNCLPLAHLNQMPNSSTWTERCDHRGGDNAARAEGNLVAGGAIAFKHRQSAATYSGSTQHEPHPSQQSAPETVAERGEDQGDHDVQEWSSARSYTSDGSWEYDPDCDEGGCYQEDDAHLFPASNEPAPLPFSLAESQAAAYAPQQGHVNDMLMPNSAYFQQGNFDSSRLLPMTTFPLQNGIHNGALPPQALRQNMPQLTSLPIQQEYLQQTPTLQSTAAKPDPVPQTLRNVALPAGVNVLNLSAQEQANALCSTHEYTTGSLTGFVPQQALHQGFKVPRSRIQGSSPGNQQHKDPKLTAHGLSSAQQSDRAGSAPVSHTRPRSLDQSFKFDYSLSFLRDQGPASIDQDRVSPARYLHQPTPTSNWQDFAPFEPDSSIEGWSEAVVVVGSPGPTIYGSRTPSPDIAKAQELQEALDIADRENHLPRTTVQPAARFSAVPTPQDTIVPDAQVHPVAGLTGHAFGLFVGPSTFLQRPRNFAGSNADSTAGMHPRAEKSANPTASSLDPGVTVPFSFDGHTPGFVDQQNHPPENGLTPAHGYAQAQQHAGAQENGTVQADDGHDENDGLANVLRSIQANDVGERVRQVQEEFRLKREAEKERQRQEQERLDREREREREHQEQLALYQQQITEMQMQMQVQMNKDKGKGKGKSRRRP